MKTKKLNKKLSLNKKTVSNLNHNELKLARGGVLTTDWRDTCAQTCENTCDCETNYAFCNITDTCDGTISWVQLDTDTGEWYCGTCG